MTSRRGEAWKKRIGDGYDPDIWRTFAEPRLWLNISNGRDIDMKTDDLSTDSESESPAVNDNNSTNTKRFQDLTTGQKFKIVRALCTVHNASVNKDGSLSVLVNHEVVDKLLQTTEKDGLPLTIAKNVYRNRVRGVIRNRIIVVTPESEILEELSEYNVTEVRKIDKPKRDDKNQIIRNSKKEVIYEPSGMAVITFELETLPNHINFFYTRLEVTQYEPDPLHCKVCFLFGHAGKNCPNKAIPICGRCSKKKHEGTQCEEDPKCRNCDTNSMNADHSNYSRDCPIWIKEKEIARVKETQKIPYPAAKAVVEKKS